MEPRGRQRGEALIEPLVYAHFGQFGVVEARPPQLAAPKAEPERFDQVQPRAGIRAQADDVAGVGRNLRLVEDDLKHGAQCDNRRP